MKQQQLMVQQMMMQQHQQQLLAQQHQQHLLAMQQQQQQQHQQQQQQQVLNQICNKFMKIRCLNPNPQAPHLAQFGSAHPLLGGLGLGTEHPARGFPSPDPLRSLLGGLQEGGSAQGQDPLKALLARQQQQQQHFVAPSPPLHHVSRAPPAAAQSSLFSGLATSGPEPPAAQQGFDPIQSLLQQLQGGRADPGAPAVSSAAAPVSSGTVQYSSGQQQPTYSRPAGGSVWDLPEAAPSPPAEAALPMAGSVWAGGASPSPSPPADSSSGQEEAGAATPPGQEQEDSGGNTSFVKPKVNEKKDKKSKKAEEKRRAKEKARKEGEGGPYIPGMSAIKPEEQVVASGCVMDQRQEDDRRAGQEVTNWIGHNVKISFLRPGSPQAVAAQRAQVEALGRLQEEQRIRLEREEQQRLQQERLAKLVSKISICGLDLYGNENCICAPALTRLCPGTLG
jgi:hypothetical protein